MSDDFVLSSSHYKELLTVLRDAEAYAKEADKELAVVRKERDALLFAVARKFVGESRFETALRYIQEAERNATTGPHQAKEPNEPV